MSTRPGSARMPREDRIAVVDGLRPRADVRPFNGSRREPVIALDRLNVRFDGKTAVSDVSLGIRPEEFVSLVGPSGCGKTTVLNVMAGLVPAAAIDGQCSVFGSQPFPGNERIAYMLARDALCPWLTTVRNVELGNLIRGKDKTASHAKALALLEAVGLIDARDLFPKALSQGMRQRVALARTFCLESPILLMDEPFGALDVFTKIQLGELLLALWEAERRTVVFVTHDLGEAVSMSDRVIVMGGRPGRIIADIAVPLERPRHIAQLQTSTSYHDVLKEVWGALQKGMEN
ncbi:MAG: ABC transporter ATP-binding protein [Lautropia sp.]